MRRGGQSGAGSSSDLMAGSQYWRNRLPIIVPGPIRVSSSLSRSLSIAKTSQPQTAIFRTGYALIVFRCQLPVSVIEALGSGGSSITRVTKARLSLPACPVTSQQPGVGNTSAVAWNWPE